jgi:hypothetical protein
MPKIIPAESQLISLANRPQVMHSGFNFEDVSDPDGERDMDEDSESSSDGKE